MNRRYLGAAHGVAEAFGIIAVILGAIPAILMWTSMCVAFQKRFFKSMAILLVCAGVASFITLSFFASDLCQNGCVWQEGATFAVVAGLVFFIAAGLVLMVGPAKKGRAIKCGCCANDAEFLYEGVPTSVSVTETLKKDGGTTVETVTKHPDGTETVQITSTKKIVESDVEPSGEENLEKEEAAGSTMEKVAESEVDA